MSPVEYKPGAVFPGVIDRTVERSSPAWPAPVRAREDAPNVLLVVLDDVGYGQLGCYGSPIRTPNIDRLAAAGLVYNSMHTTALCSPTRACILTGRNHHSNGMGVITEVSTGYPGYHAHIPRENGFLSEILLAHGYSTFAVGKWHLTPAEQTSAAGPFDRWPLGRGFERYYGFLGADTHQYFPDLVHDNHQVEPPRTPEEGYHLTEDLVDKSILFIADAKQVAPGKPFFLYLAPGACHAPHHVPAEWADGYKGVFDDGWEAYRRKVHARQLELGVLPAGTALTRQDPDVPPWDGLSVEERRLYARMMEVYAGFLEHTDHQLGRLLCFLQRIGELDNTLILLISDNGASAEGGPTGSVNEVRFLNNVPELLEDNLAAMAQLGGPRFFNHYPWGWTWAGDTPFKRWKRESYRGGVSDPFVVHWPSGIRARGEVRTQYAHAIDILPTVLDALGLDAPAQIRGASQAPIEGVSFAHTFDDARQPSRHRTQYFEMFAHRAIYHDGWRAVCPVPGPSFAEAGVGFGQRSLTAEQLRELDAGGWELYHVAEDFSESQDLSAQHPDLLKEMIDRWYVEAGRYNVLPLDSRGAQRLNEARPRLAGPRSRFVYYPGTSAVPEHAAVSVLNRPHSITAEVEISPGGDEGVLLSHGGLSGGYTLFVKDRKLHYVHNYVGAQELHLESTEAVQDGPSELRFEFHPTGEADLSRGEGTPGRGELYIRGKPVGAMDFPVTLPITVGLAGGLTCGRDGGWPVSSAYEPPFAFTGILHRVIVEVAGEPVRDEEAEMRILLGRQ
ncbi:arylsulfatase [Sorangium sp. So ce315]|uniref:arylsulfatase n=1 Tax=Sorangium sp. So ce315 TaxID=3133299 RepID=UPI003F6396FA